MCKHLFKFPINLPVSDRKNLCLLCLRDSEAKQTGRSATCQVMRVCTLVDKKYADVFAKKELMRKFSKWNGVQWMEHDWILKLMLKNDLWFLIILFSEWCYFNQVFLCPSIYCNFGRKKYLCYIWFLTERIFKSCLPL